MDRIEQVRRDTITKFFADNGRMPTDLELKDLLRNTDYYAPLTKPMVPLPNALSNADYIRRDLFDLMQDRTLIDDLLSSLSNKIERVEAASIAEANNTIKFAEALLTDTKENNYSVVFNETPKLYNAADVSDWYLKIYGDELYAEDPGTSSDPVYLAQYIVLDSFNVTGGAEGISLVENSTEQIQAALAVTPYAESDQTILQTISMANPISIIASGIDNINKGVDLTFDIMDKRVASIVLDVSSINCTVLIDGSELFTKSLDGPSTLSIGATVKEKLTIRLFNSSSQVHVLVNDLSLYSSTEDASASFSTGQYVTLELDVPKDIVPLTFNPDEYIPNGTSIEWEWSNSRILWNPLEQDATGKYIPMKWNLQKPNNPTTEDPYAFTSSPGWPGGIEMEGTDLTMVGQISSYGTDDRIDNAVVTAGFGCVLFAKESMKGFNAFICYLNVPDDTGYKLELYNPSTADGIRLISNISIKSDGYSINAVAAENIMYDIPKGIHKLELQISSSIDLSSYDFTLQNSKGILEVLLDDFLVDFKFNFSADALGRTITYGIQLHGLTETDVHELAFMEELKQVERFAVVESRSHSWSGDRLNYNFITRKYVPNEHFDIIAVHDDYEVNETKHTGYELHFYEGTGSSNWEVDMYHTPNDDVTLNENSTDYTPVGKTVTIPSSELPNTSTEKRELVTWSGSDGILEVSLAEKAYNAVTLVRDNIRIYNDLGLDSGLEEDFGSFDVKGRTVFEDTLTANDDEQTFTLAKFPQVGYCSLENWDGLLEHFTLTALETSCTQQGGTWYTGFCTGSDTTDKNTCLCGENGVWNGTECTEGEVTSNTWKEFIQAQDDTGANTYNITEVDIDNKEVTVTGLNGLSGLNLEIHYEFGDLQSLNAQYSHEQSHTLLTSTDIVLLERTPAGSSVDIYVDGSNDVDTVTSTFDSNLNAHTVDLSGFTHGQGGPSVGDTILLKYGCSMVMDTDNSTNTLTLSNLPNTEKTRKIYKEYGTAAEPTASTSVVLEHPPASRAIGGTHSDPNGNLYIEVNGTEITSNIVNSITGNVIDMDLSAYTAAEGDIQNPVQLFIAYESYEHTEDYKILIEYDYYKPEPFTFNYQYNVARMLNGHEISQTKLHKFYDISYYKIAGNDLYMKAQLTSSGKESPVIRRLKFER